MRQRRLRYIYQNQCVKEVIKVIKLIMNIHDYYDQILITMIYKKFDQIRISNHEYCRRNKLESVDYQPDQWSARLIKIYIQKKPLYIVASFASHVIGQNLTRSDRQCDSYLLLLFPYYNIFERKSNYKYLKIKPYGYIL